MLIIIVLASVVQHSPFPVSCLCLHCTGHLSAQVVTQIAVQCACMHITTITKYFSVSSLKWSPHKYTSIQCINRCLSCIQGSLWINNNYLLCIFAVWNVCWWNLFKHSCLLTSFTDLIYDEVIGYKPKKWPTSMIAILKFLLETCYAIVYVFSPRHVCRYCWSNN